MALAQIYSAVAGHIITAARWNNEFGNIYTNGTDVAFPLTKAVSLAGWTLTLDDAGQSTLSSSASIGMSMSAGSKTGTPSANGNIVNIPAATMTDTGTAASGTNALYTGVSIRRPILAATNANVTTTIAASFYIENSPQASTNQTITTPYAIYVAAGVVKFVDTVELGTINVTKDDARTATVATPLTISAATSGTPAADIGTGLLFRAESADENPSNVGQVEFAFSDVSAGTEDSYFQILTRRAGAALAAAWKFISTGTFKGIITHANTADRTYTFPDRSFAIGTQGAAIGPSSIGAGSSFSHEGTVTYSANQSLNGVHTYTSVTLDAAKTLTVDNNQYRLVLLAYDTITINGSINASGAGKVGGTAGAAGGGAGGDAADGSSQPGGGGGGSSTHSGGDGGDARINVMVQSAGGVGGTAGNNASAAGGAITANEGLTDPFNVWSGGPGGGGGGATAAAAGGAGGRGGGSVVLIAPTVVLGASSVINTSGLDGTVGGSSHGGGGGGGGAGNILIICQSFTNNGCTFTTSGGSGGAAGAGSGGAGTAGRAGWLQVLVYGG